MSEKGVRMEFKSKQWFGASVRSDGEHIMVRTSAGDVYGRRDTEQSHDPDRCLYLLINI